MIAGTAIVPSLDHVTIVGTKGGRSSGGSASQMARLIKEAA